MRPFARLFSTASEIGHVFSTRTAYSMLVHPGAVDCCTALTPGLSLMRDPTAQSVTLEWPHLVPPLGPLEVQIPQRMETELECEGGVVVSNKLEGQSFIVCKGDLILEGTVRGAYIDLESSGGGVHARKTLEGVVSAKGGSISIAKLLSTRAALTSTGSSGGGVKVGAAYCSDLVVTVSKGGAVSMDVLHGSAKVHCEGNGGATVAIGGITGTVKVTGGASQVTLHFDSLRGPNSVECQGDVVVRLGSSSGSGAIIGRVSGHPEVLARVSVEGGSMDASGRLTADATAGGGQVAGGGENGGGSGGGSGKIREGSEISGWWESSSSSSSSSGSGSGGSNQQPSSSPSGSPSGGGGESALALQVQGATRIIIAPPHSYRLF
jgi:hypothetical protein